MILLITILLFIIIILLILIVFRIDPKIKNNVLKFIKDVKKIKNTSLYFINLLFDIILFLVSLVTTVGSIYSVKIILYEIDHDYLFYVYKKTGFDGFTNEFILYLFGTIISIILSILSTKLFIVRYKNRNIDNPISYLLNLITDFILFIFSILGFVGIGFWVYGNYYKFQNKGLERLFDDNKIWFIYTILFITLTSSIWFYFRIKKRFRDD